MKNIGYGVVKDKEIHNLKFMEEHIMSIDRADWHWESAEKLFRKKYNVVGNLTEEQANKIWLFAANHIGLFMKWIN